MKSFQDLREEVVLLNKNGINFLLAASLCWGAIAVIWYLPGEEMNKAFFTFSACAPMMPLAYLFSKLLNTKWNIKNNPLNGLGIWLNLAQLFYFPFVFLLMGRNPGEMPMALAIITGAHFFPYAWFYQSKGFAVMAGVIAVGTTLIGTSTRIGNPPVWIALLMMGSIWVLTVWSFLDYQKVAGKSTHHLPTGLGWARRNQPLQGEQVQENT